LPGGRKLSLCNETGWRFSHLAFENLVWGVEHYYKHSCSDDELQRCEQAQQMDVIFCQPTGK
jgi:hypothetical protein